VVVVGSCRIVVAAWCGVVWQPQLHGLMVAVAGGGSGGHSRVMEVVVVMPHRVVVAAWRGGHGRMA